MLERLSGDRKERMILLDLILGGGFLGLMTLLCLCLCVRVLVRVRVRVRAYDIFTYYSKHTRRLICVMMIDSNRTMTTNVVSPVAVGLPGMETGKPSKMVVGFC
jgi:hypothetical protein